MIEIHTYRIWRRTDRRWPHWKWPFHTDRWLRSWQAEWEPDCMWAPRSWTEAGVRRKAIRWLLNGTDIRKHERRYGPKPELWRARGHA